MLTTDVILLLLQRWSMQVSNASEWWFDRYACSLRTEPRIPLTPGFGLHVFLFILLPSYSGHTQPEPVPTAKKEEKRRYAWIAFCEQERGRWGGDMWNRCKGWLLLVPLVNRRAAYPGMKSAVFVLGKVPETTASALFPA